MARERRPRTPSKHRTSHEASPRRSGRRRLRRPSPDLRSLTGVRLVQRLPEARCRLHGRVRCLAPRSAPRRLRQSSDRRSSRGWKRCEDDQLKAMRRPNFALGGPELLSSRNASDGCQHGGGQPRLWAWSSKRQSVGVESLSTSRPTCPTAPSSTSFPTVMTGCLRTRSTRSTRRSRNRSTRPAPGGSFPQGRLSKSCVVVASLREACLSNAARSLTGARHRSLVGGESRQGPASVYR